MAGALAFAGCIAPAQAQTEPDTAPTTAASAPAAPTASSPTNSTGSFEATIFSIGPGRASLVAELPSISGKVSLTVPRPDLRAHLVDAVKGDVAKIEVNDAVHPTEVTGISEVDRPVGRGPRFLALGGSALLLAGFLAVVTGFRPQSLLIGMDNRFSNSQVQLALWFGVVAVVYGAAVALRLTRLGSGYMGGVGLTDHIIALTGLSALTFGGAKMITAQKHASANAAATTAAQEKALAAAKAAAQPPLPDGSLAAPAPAVAAAVPPPPAPAAVIKTRGDEPRLMTDLVSNDHNEADLGDVQMILVTLAAVAIFLLTAFHFLGRLPVSATMVLPDVDSSLLALFGLGQGAYLLKKAALPAGRG